MQEIIDENFMRKYNFLKTKRTKIAKLQFEVLIRLIEQNFDLRTFV